jgi:cell division protein FtsQ
MADKVLPLPRKMPGPRRLEVLRLVPSGRSLVVGVTLILLAAGLYALARGTSMFALQRVQVDGASPELAAEVQALLRTYQGRSLVAVDGAAIEQRVDGLAAVRGAVVDRAFPHTLRVRVIPELAVAVLRRGADSWLVSARGRVIAAISLGEKGALPRIWLPPTTDIQVGALLADDPGGLAARSLAAFVGSGFPKRIAFVRALDGQITLGLLGGLEVRLGAPVDLRLKIAIAHGLLPGFAPPSQGGPDYLDVAVPERPVAGRNSQPSG